MMPPKKKGKTGGGCRSACAKRARQTDDKLPSCAPIEGHSDGATGAASCSSLITRHTEASNMAWSVLTHWTLPFLRAKELRPVRHACTKWQLAADEDGQEREESDRARRFNWFLRRSNAQPVHIAAFRGDVSALKEFSPGELATMTAERKFSTVHCAAMGGHLDALLYCLAQGGGRMSDLSYSGSSVTQCAAFSGNIALIQYCVKNGGGRFTDGTIAGRTVTHWAALGGSVEAIRFCRQKKGGNMSTPNRRGVSLTHFAAWGGSITALQYCCSHNGGHMWFRDQLGRTVTHWACYSGDIDMIEYCCRHGGGTLRNKALNGEGPLAYAKRSNNPEAVEYCERKLREEEDAARPEGAAQVAAETSACDAVAS